nr:probable LRR receptor-like serine/threonine-protein kinase At4g26540 [Tanacetum cinerariifolium]
MTGRHPIDSTIPDGSHLVQWVRDHLHNKRNPVDISDLKQRGTPDARNAADTSCVISIHQRTSCRSPNHKGCGCNHEDS